MEMEGQDPSEFMIEFESTENPEDVEDVGYGCACVLSVIFETDIRVLNR